MEHTFLMLQPSCLEDLLLPWIQGTMADRVSAPVSASGEAGNDDEEVLIEDLQQVNVGLPVAEWIKTRLIQSARSAVKEVVFRNDKTISLVDRMRHAWRNHNRRRNLCPRQKQPTNDETSFRVRKKYWTRCIQARLFQCLHLCSKFATALKSKHLG